MEGWDQRKFDETLDRYAEVSSRTHQEIVNTKAYYVARKALWNTPKADSYKMKQQLGGIVTVRRENKRGKMVKRRELQLVMGTAIPAPLVSLIINARLGRSGEKGLYGKQMERAGRKLLGSRASSIAFIKSGWLQPIRDIAPFVKDKGQAAPPDPASKQVGRAKGLGKPAKQTNNPSAEIVNLASAKRDHRAALIKYGEPALRQALMEEDASMNEYIEKKMRPATDQFNQQQS